MTKKHYEAIAAILKSYDMYTEEEMYTAQSIARGLADYFATDNKNFNRRMFLTACGIPNYSLDLEE